MQINEVSIKRVWFRKIKYNNSSYTYLKLFKTRPIKRNNTETILYIDKAYRVTLEEQDIIELTKEAGSEVYGSKVFNYIKDNVSAFYSTFMIYDLCPPSLRWEKIIKDKKLQIDPDKLLVLNFNDAVEVNNITAAEIKREKEKQKKESQQKVIKNLLLPSIEKICEENGLRISNDYVYFDSAQSMRNFLTEAFNELISKKFEEVGIEVKLRKNIGKLSLSSILLDIKDIKIKDIQE